MEPSVLGLNHATASVELREKLSLSDYATALNEVSQLDSVRGAMVLSTCNRSEIVADISADQASALREWWLEKTGVANVPEHTFYLLREREAIKHLAGMAAGLDSMVLGEAQILGQFREAYTYARDEGFLSASLDWMLQQVLNLARKVRASTAIGQNPLSIASVAVERMNMLFSSKEPQRALLIGAGETMRLIAEHLHSSGVREMVIANRSRAAAQRLARPFNAEVVGLPSLEEQLYRVNLVVSATASQLPIVGKGLVETALHRRKNRPLLMFDLAVPRDIEPEVGELRNVYLYDLDRLQDGIAQGERERLSDSEAAQSMVDAGVEEIFRFLREGSSAGLAKDLRARGDQDAQVELQWALQRLQTEGDTEKVLQELVHRLTGRLLHTPMLLLRSLGDYDPGLAQRLESIIKRRERE